jgi:calpain, invertebrate
LDCIINFNFLFLKQTVKPFKDQDYYQLKSEFSQYNLFEDPEFPATNLSLFHHQSVPGGIRWKRPHEVCDNPQFEYDTFDRRDLDQGYLGNCWFIAGCVGIMQNAKLFAEVVPPNQNFDSDYNGLFHFRFWHQGEWVDVCVDDRLPFWSDNRLVFCSNKQQPNEFWSALLEKAYAKLYGCYENLDGGFTTDALIDMSGGIAEIQSLKGLGVRQKDELWKVVKQAYEKGSIIGCSLDSDSRVREARLSNGLVKGHAYTITRLASVLFNGRNVDLLRIR